MKIMSTLLAAVALGAASAPAAIVTRPVDYEHNGVKLQGYLAYDDAKTKEGKLPGVLIVHEWWGLNDYVRGRAEQLAKLGYVAFALDMYGAGVLAQNPDEAKKLAGPFYGKPLMAERAQAGLDQLLGTGLVDPARVAAIGYCFGAVTKAKILICHGALDPGMSRDAVEAVIKSLDDGKFDYQFKQYAGAYHAFTNPDSDATAAKFPALQGFIAYSPSADRRSFADMQSFFGEIFAPKG